MQIKIKQINSACVKNGKELARQAKLANARKRKHADDDLQAVCVDMAQHFVNKAKSKTYFVPKKVDARNVRKEK